MSSGYAGNSRPGLTTSRAGLGVISFAQNGGGVANVARLLRQALYDGGANPWLVELGVERRDAASAARRAGFALRLLDGHMFRRADWIFYNHVSVARAHYALPATLRLPYGVFVHDVEAWAPDLDRIKRATLASATVVIANSAYTARRVREVHGASVNVVPCPLGLLEEAKSVEPIDDRLLSTVGPNAALIVGRVASDERYKGHDQLIEAWPLVLSAVPNAQLFIAGWGDDIGRLRAKAVGLAVDRAIRFCDYINEATRTALLERVAVYAMPSSREGFGLVYLEAMRAGVPCIGSTADAAGDVIEHRVSGLLVDRANIRELAQALIEIFSDRTLRESLGSAGRRRYETHFTYAHFRDRLLPIMTRAFVPEVCKAEKWG